MLVCALAGCRTTGLAPACVGCPEPPPVCHKIRSDFCEMYRLDGQNIAFWSAGLGLGATIAHTDLDENLRSWYQDDVRSTGTDDFAEVVKHFGEGQEVFPLMAGALLLGELMPDYQPTSVIGQWGDRGLRAALVGTPSLLFLQAATGASRPGETSAESDWVPFRDNNGVSGHAFAGALPFITAAKMTDNPWAKAGWYTASTLTAWSRVNDDAHYTSQAILGWGLSYLACSAIDRTEQGSDQLQFTAMPMPGGIGVGFIFKQ